MKKNKIIEWGRKHNEDLFQAYPFFGKERINKFLVYIFIFHLIDSLKEFRAYAWIVSSDDTPCLIF